jgi:hypothetical protein
MSYEMRGQFLEACDCQVMCPCWFEQDPDEDECTGISTWYVEQGQINGVDVSDLITVSVSSHGGHRHGAAAWVALLIDERASQQQEEALVAAFSGKLGGPLGELAEMTHEVSSVQRAHIELTSDGATTRVTAGQAVSAVMSPLTGSTGRVITVADGALATTHGTPTEVGRSSTLQLHLGDPRLDLEIESRSANRGRFTYLHRDQAETTT